MANISYGNNIGYDKKWGNSKGITLDNIGEGKL